MCFGTPPPSCALLLPHTKSRPSRPNIRAVSIGFSHTLPAHRMGRNSLAARIVVCNSEAGASGSIARPPRQRLPPSLVIESASDQISALTRTVLPEALPMNANDLSLLTVVPHIVLGNDKVPEYLLDAGVPEHETWKLLLCPCPLKIGVKLRRARGGTLELAFHHSLFEVVDEFEVRRGCWAL